MYGVDPEADGAQAYYDSLLRPLCRMGRGLHQGRRHRRLAALRLPPGRDQSPDTQGHRPSCGRPIVLSLSPGPAPLDCAGNYAPAARQHVAGD